ncbi:MAG: hypothetical protein CM1200mP22_01440 [Dehalococcoidia bacterium]|nr:MAG: hypothetical protein CM1200mP22_01440 [Dehalococcoidia bacterium]
MLSTSAGGGFKTVVEKIIRPILLDKDPMDTEVRWRDMIQAASASDMGGAVHCAIAGLDIACGISRAKPSRNPSMSS